jgi:hypothetical protein
MVKIEDYATAREIVASEIKTFNEENENFFAKWEYRENERGGYFAIAVTNDDHDELLSEYFIVYIGRWSLFDASFIKDNLNDMKKQLMYRVNMTQAYKALGLYVPQELRD